MSTAMVKKNETMASLRTMLETAAPKIQQVLPAHMTAEKLVRITTAAISRTPTLLECTPLSIVQSVMIAARLGLECDGVLGSAYLVPYLNSKTGRMEAQLIPGYRGLIDLARRSGSVTGVWAHVVHENDVFEVELGLEPSLTHRPAMIAKGAKIGVYAVAKMTDGSAQFEFMSAEQVESIKSRSRAKSGPWITDEDEMWRKTAVRRLSKYLPLSVEMAAALTLQAGAEAGETSIGQVGSVLDLDLGEEPEPISTKADQLAAKIAGKKQVEEPKKEPPAEPPEAEEENPSLSQETRYAIRSLRRIKSEDGLKAWNEKFGKIYRESTEEEQEAINAELDEARLRIAGE
jgi:recombination protein RecT